MIINKLDEKNMDNENIQKQYQKNPMKDRYVANLLHLFTHILVLD